MMVKEDTTGLWHISREAKRYRIITLAFWYSDSLKSISTPLHLASFRRVAVEARHTRSTTLAFHFQCSAT